MPTVANHEKEADQTVQFLTETKYMQQYRLRADLYGSFPNITAARNANDEMEFFITYGGKVWNYYPNPSVDTGYGVTELKFNVGKGFQGPLLVAAGNDAQGKIVVFAAHAKAFQFIQETNEAGKQRWGSPTDLALFKKTNDYDPPSDAQAITSLSTHNIDSGLCIGVMAKISNDPVVVYRFAYSEWEAAAQSAPPVFSWLPDLLPSQRCVWSGTFKETVSFTLLKDDYWDYRLSDREWTIHQLAHKKEAQSVAVAGGHYFAVGKRGELSVLHNENDQYSWKDLDNGPYVSVQASLDATGAINIFALHENGMLNWGRQANKNDSWPTPSIIASDVTTFSIAQDGTGDIHVFYLGRDQKTITRMDYRSTNSSRPQSYPINTPVQITNEIEEFFAYSTDVTAKDGAGAPLANTEIKITSSEPTQITVNSHTYMIDAKAAAMVKTDGMGMLNIVQPADKLGAAALQIEATKQPDTPYGLRQWEATVLPRLASSTSSESLVNAKLADGSYLLPDEYRKDPEKADSLAKSVTECVRLIKEPSIAIAKGRGVMREQYHAGFGAVSPGSAARLSRINAPANFVPWQLDFPSRLPQVQQTQQSSSQKSEKKHAETWGGNFEDLLKAIENGTVQVSSAGMHQPHHSQSESRAVGEPQSRGIGDVVLKIVLEIPNVFGGVIQASKAVVEFVIRTASDVLHAVVAVFSGAGAMIQRTKEWLAFLFDWDDILRTKKAIVHAIDQVLTFAEYSVKEITDSVEAQFTSWHQNLNKGFDAIESKLTDNFADFFNQGAPEKDPRVSEAISNNFLYRSVLDNAQKSKSEAPGEMNDEDKHKLRKAITEFEKHEESNDELTKTISSLGDLAYLDNVYELALPKLFEFLRKVSSSLLTGAQKMVTAMLELLRSALKSLNDFLDAKWNIPFVSAFYLKIAGAELNAKDLMALLIAIPVTAAWKVVRGTALFENDTVLAEFQQGYTWQQMKKFLPNTQQSYMVQSAERSAWSTFLDKWSPFLGATAAYASGFGILISTLNALTETLSARLLSIIGVVLGIIGLVSLPSGTMTHATWVLSIFWVWADVASIANFGVSFLSAIAPAERTGALLGTGFGVIFTILAVQAMITGEVSNTRDSVLSLCVPISTACSFFNWAPIKTIMTPLIANTVILVISAVTGSSCMACGNLLYTKP